MQNIETSLRCCALPSLEHKSDLQKLLIKSSDMLVMLLVSGIKSVLRVFILEAFACRLSTSGIFYQPQAWCVRLALAIGSNLSAYMTSLCDAVPLSSIASGRRLERELVSHGLDQMSTLQRFSLT